MGDSQRKMLRKRPVHFLPHSTVASILLEATLATMNRVKEVERINAADLRSQIKADTKGDAGKRDVTKSWHYQYKVCGEWPHIWLRLHALLRHFSDHTQPARHAAPRIRPTYMWVVYLTT